MLDSVYVGFSGLNTFSTGLRAIGNNVSNMNSSGYKGASLQFSDLYYKMETTVNGGKNEPFYSKGTGVGIRGERINFTDGERRETGSSTDLAISGKGFFILRDDGGPLYTRNGNFEFDDAGYLVDPSSGARVAGVGAGGSLADINISSMRNSPGKATTEISFTGNLASNDTDNVHAISGVTLFDASGGTTEVKIVLTRGTVPGVRSWSVAVESLAGVSLGTGEIQFSGDGSPLAGFTNVTFTHTPPGGSAQAVTLNFGTAGSFNGVTNFSGISDQNNPNSIVSTMKVATQDGYGVGVLQRTTFDDKGVLALTYSNGQTATSGQVALAWFDDMQVLRRVDGARFANDSEQIAHVSAAGEQGLGRIFGSRLEASNVDLANEFSQLIIIQRGYQSSSQVVTAANEMAQQVLDLVKRR